MEQLEKDTFDHDIDLLTTVHYVDLKPLVNSYIQQEVQIQWDVSIHGRDLYLLKPTLGPSKEFQYLTRKAEGVLITWLRIGHTKATKSYFLSRGLLTTCQHYDQTLTIEHMLLKCTAWQQSWWILHSWLIEDPIWDDSHGLHSSVSKRSWILLSDMNGHIFSTTPYLI